MRQFEDGFAKLLKCYPDALKQSQVEQLSSWLQRRLTSRFRSIIDTDAIATDAILESLNWLSNSVQDFCTEVQISRLAYLIAKRRLIDSLLHYKREAKSRSNQYEKGITEAIENVISSDAKNGEMLEFIASCLEKSEIDILVLLLQGFSTIEIASRCNISSRSVRRSRASVRKKTLTLFAATNRQTDKQNSRILSPSRSRAAIERMIRLAELELRTDDLVLVTEFST